MAINTKKCIAIQGFVKNEYSGSRKLTFSVFAHTGVFACNGDVYMENGNFEDHETSEIVGPEPASIRLTRCDIGLGSGATLPTDYQWNRVQDLVNLAEVICAFGLLELAGVCREF